MALRHGQSRLHKLKSTSVKLETPVITKSEHLDDRARRLIWAIAIANARFDDIRYFWAEALGISGPQWMILMAVSDFDATAGAPVRDVASRLEVDPTFVASQSKLLEAAGWLTRAPSKSDSRAILLFQTSRCRKEIGKLEGRQSALNEFIYEDINHRDLENIILKLTALTKRLEKASLRLELDA
jgi:DNA-binding MarR family transcriptional regulator